MALSLRPKRSPSKLQRARSLVTTIVALRTLGVRKVVSVAAIGTIATVGMIAARRSRSKDVQPVSGAAPTEASAPTPPQNGTTSSLQGATEQARSAAASLAPHGSSGA